MKHSRLFCIVVFATITLSFSKLANAADQPLLGPVGTTTTYILDSRNATRETTVRRLVMSLGAVETHESGTFQWLKLDAAKANGESFRVAVLEKAYPNRSLTTAATNLARYILQEGNAQPKEFVHRVTGEPVLPANGA